MLIILSGLPGTGKSTVSKELCHKLKAVYLRIDSIEQGIREAFQYNDNKNAKVVAEGYMAAYAIAADNLQMGHKVVADSVNPIELTRKAWRDVAIKNNKPFLEVELICSDKEQHRHRVETRCSDIKGLTVPTWEDVINRDYQPWQREHVLIDTAIASAEEAVSIICSRIV